jgi:hypothetical protein
MNPINDDNFNQSFRDRFQNFEDHDISEHNWEAIQAAIPQKMSFLQANWRKSTALLCLLLISTCVFQSKWQNTLSPDVQSTTLQQDAFSTNTNAITLNEKKDPSVKNAFSAINSISNSVIKIEKTKTINALKNNSINKNLIKEQLNSTSNLTLNNSNDLGQTINKNGELNNVNNGELNQELITKNELNNTIKTTELMALLPIINSNKTIDFNKENPELNTPFIVPNHLSFITRRSSLFFAVTPQYSFFNFTPNTKDKIYLSHFELTNQLSAKRLGIKIETGIAYQLNKHFDLNLSLNAQTINKNISYSTQTNVLDSFRIQALNASNIRIERIANYNKLEEQNNYYLIGFNAGLQYTTGNKNNKLRYFIATGLGINKLLNQTKMETFNVDASMGIKRKISTQYDLSIAPQINYFMQKNTFSSPILQAQPYTIGLKMGISQR